MLGGDVRDVRGDHGDHGLDEEVVEPPVDLGDDPADHEAKRDPAERDERELAEGMRRGELTTGDGGEGDLKRDQAGRVVDQALALEDGDQPRRDAAAAA